MKEKDLDVPACTVCGHELTVHYSKVKDTVTNEEFAIYRCIECGLGHTLPQPDNLASYYDNMYYGNRHGFTEGYSIKRRIKIVLSATKDRDGKRLLDVGCGDGAFLRAMSILGWDVAGTEINPHIGSMKGIVVKERIEDLSDFAAFDCITMWHTLEHMRNIGAMLAQIASLLKPDGKLIIAVPNSSSFQARIFKGTWLHLDVPRHLYHFDVPALQNCLSMNGFFIEHQAYQELEYDLIGWTQSALNAIFKRPNILFDYLRGKKTGCGTLSTVLNVSIGSLLIMLSLPAVMAERLMNRSGTIITTARRHGE